VWVSVGWAWMQVTVIPTFFSILSRLLRTAGAALVASDLNALKIIGSPTKVHLTWHNGIMLFSFLPMPNKPHCFLQAFLACSLTILSLVAWKPPVWAFGSWGGGNVVLRTYLALTLQQLGNRFHHLCSQRSTETCLLFADDVQATSNLRIKLGNAPHWVCQQWGKLIPDAGGCLFKTRYFLGWILREPPPKPPFQCPHPDKKGTVPYRTHSGAQISEILNVTPGNPGPCN